MKEWRLQENSHWIQDVVDDCHNRDQSYLPYPWKFEAENFARFLPIMFNDRKAEVTDSYHKIYGLTRIGDNMAVS